MSMAGKMRLSEIFRSSTSSLFPVPLNSSKITSSMREPVSISAVAMMVSEPPSSMLRAAPKKRLGRCSALASTPPERILPECGTTVLCARAEAGDRVEQDHHVALVLDQALGLLDHHVGHLHVALGRLVERRRHHLALHRALHVGDFLGALVDQQHDQHHLGVVLGDGVGDLLQQDGLAGLGRRGDERPLALSDRAQQVDDAGLDAAVLGLEVELLLRIERRQVVEQDLVLGRLRTLEVDRLDAQQREVALALLGRAHLAGDRVAGVQSRSA